MASFDSSGTREYLQPDDGRRESGWLLLCIAIILTLAAVLLQFNQTRVRMATTHLHLGYEGRAMLTSLINAATEIRFLAPAPGELLPLTELIDMALPPFAADTEYARQYQWQLLPGGCYYGVPGSAEQATFILKPGASGAEVYWYIQPPFAADCADLTQWQTVDSHD